MTVLSFPDVRAEGAPASPDAQVPAPTRARAREAEREPRWRMPMPSGRAVAAIFTGGSLAATAPPSVLATWAGHKVAADYFRHWYFRYPRLAFGAWNAWVEAPAAYLLVLSGRSPVLRMLVIASVLFVLRCFGIHVLWSWL